ncbi:GSCFA domain-containing protein [Pseudodonghicola xiamenensis]|nr:GSCFA domain-containing protein [Pseudodonghicola xiamenensis]
MKGLWTPKFQITSDTRVATAGSCFAQHISAAMQGRGYTWLDSEPAPVCMSKKVRKSYNYEVFSFRTGNIYTPALLRQWVFWALGLEAPSSEVMETDGRFFDPYRPAIEPGGYACAEEVLLARETTLACIRAALIEMDLFVFTLGLTEGWINTTDGTVYPVCPGTIAGQFDADLHAFRNFSYDETLQAMQQAFEAIKEVNPNVKFLLTVSPVPLTATASGDHVLVSTTYSKSVLRAVAGALSSMREDTDYFPSYEVISGAPYRAMFFDPNLRTVTPKGVEHVMSHFFAGVGMQQETPVDPIRKGAPKKVETVGDDLVCEEAVMEAWNAN